ncbi:hypothetical protein EBBID32_26760 [Sphingobium indicum BiD32]|uniref:Major facilitator superfamily (MFS) profile domain-containing protein n=2 Tax=Sphingobium indicum TaxID=332055 RepID=N1MM95_9SPHN|nr:hypothetical protein EBBID32_26760 [Sphingobium indicum BiD32]
MLAAAGGVLLIVTWLGLAETHNVAHPVPLHPVEVLKRYRFVLANRATLGFSLMNGFSFACMFAFITASPIVFMAEFGLSQAAYSGMFFTAGLGTITGSIVAGRSRSGHRAIRAGVCDDSYVGRLTTNEMAGS